MNLIAAILITFSAALPVHATPTAPAHTASAVVISQGAVSGSAGTLANH